MLSWLKTMIEESPGVVSSMRSVLVLFTLAVVAVWVFLSIYNHAMQDIPSTVVSLFGMLAAGKVVQSFGEK